jgi:hypothetical protein
LRRSLCTLTVLLCADMQQRARVCATYISADRIGEGGGGQPQQRIVRCVDLVLSHRCDHFSIPVEEPLGELAALFIVHFERYGQVTRNLIRSSRALQKPTVAANYQVATCNADHVVLSTADRHGWQFDRVPPAQQRRAGTDTHHHTAGGFSGHALRHRRPSGAQGRAIAVRWHGTLGSLPAPD